MPLLRDLSNYHPLLPYHPISTPWYLEGGHIAMQNYQVNYHSINPSLGHNRNPDRQTDFADFFTIWNYPDPECLTNRMIFFYRFAMD